MSKPNFHFFTLQSSAFTTQTDSPLQSSPLQLNSSALILISQLLPINLAQLGFGYPFFPFYSFHLRRFTFGCWVCSLRRFKAFRPLGPLPSPSPLHLSATTHLSLYQVCLSFFLFFSFHFLLLGFGCPSVPSALCIMFMYCCNFYQFMILINLSLHMILIIG